MQPFRILAQYFLVAGIVLPIGASKASDRELEKRGQSIMLAKCGSCHAISKTGLSPFASAPPFRDLHRKFKVEFLAEALAEGISTGHPSMPTFVFQPPEIDAIIAYLKSLK